MGLPQNRILSQTLATVSRVIQYYCTVWSALDVEAIESSDDGVGISSLPEVGKGKATKRALLINATDKSWLSRVISRCRAVRSILTIFCASKSLIVAQKSPLASLPPSTSALKFSPAPALSSSPWRASRQYEMGTRTRLRGDTRFRTIHESRGGGQGEGREKTRMEMASSPWAISTWKGERGGLRRSHSTRARAACNGVITDHSRCWVDFAVLFVLLLGSFNFCICVHRERQ